MHHLKRFAPGRAVMLLAVALLILNTAAIAEAQSGRRIPKRPTTADPTPSKDSEPPIVQPEEKKDSRPATPITIAKHLNDLIYSSDIYLNVVMNGFLERMQKARFVKPEPAGRDLNRKQAYDAAKASAARYVVWFQLQVDGMAPAYETPAYAASLYVDFVIFSPTTGKTKTSGHVYQRSRNVGGVGLPAPGSTNVQYALYYAGVELAERVLGALDLESPTSTPPTH